MKEEIFRKKSIDKMKAPESLNDYIKVSSPGIWLLLGSIIALLVGVCIWGFFGKIETKIPVKAVVENGMAVCDVENAEIHAEMLLIVEEKEYPLASVTMNQTSEEKVYHVSAETDLPDGAYDAELLLERIRPFSFVFN